MASGCGRKLMWINKGVICQADMSHGSKFWSIITKEGCKGAAIAANHKAEVLEEVSEATIVRYGFC